MSKILLSVDTETKIVLLKVDGQEINGVDQFGLNFYDKWCDKHESYNCECDLEDVLSINFGVRKDIKGKNTQTRVYYNMENSKEYKEAEAKAIAKLDDVSGFNGFELLNPTIQETIAEIFK